MEIKRDKYLNDLIIRVGKGMIEIVTGFNTLPENARAAVPVRCR